MRISDWSSDVCSSDLIQRQPIPGDTILNVNVPDLPWQQLQGFAVTRAGNRHRAETTLQTTDPRGRTIYWIGTAGAEADCGPGTDFHAIAAGKDRKSVVEGKGVSVSVDIGGRSSIKKKKNK